MSLRKVHHYESYLSIYLHFHFSYTHFMNMLVLNSPKSSTIEHSLSSFSFFLFWIGIVHNLFYSSLIK